MRNPFPWARAQQPRNATPDHPPHGTPLFPPSLLPGKIAAAVAFKNAISLHWEAVPGEFTYPDAEKALVRANLLSVTVGCSKPATINAMMVAVRKVAEVDYPTKWPELPAGILAVLGCGDTHRVTVIAAVITEVCKSYVHLPVEELDPARALVGTVFPAATAALTSLLAGPPTPEAGEVARLLIKAYYQLVARHLEEFACLTDTNSLSTWCGACMSVLSKRILQPGLDAAGTPGVSGGPENPEEEPKWVWWGARKWVMKVFTRFATRYGQPLYAQNALMKSLAAGFNKSVCPAVMGLVLADLQGWAGVNGSSVPSPNPPALHRRFPEGVLFAYLKFVEACVDYASCWPAIKGALPWLLPCVVLRLERLTEEEIETMNEDPGEYLRAITDPYSIASARSAAEYLLLMLLDRRRAVVSPLVDSLVSTQLAAAGADPIARDAVLALLLCIAGFLKQDKPHRQQLDSMLTGVVAPEFLSPSPILRVRACLLFQAFSDHKFGSPAIVEAASKAVLNSLGDSCVVVAVVAAQCLSGLLESQEVTQDVVKPHVEAVLTKLFGMLDTVGMEMVVDTVHTMVAVYSDDMATLAGPVVAKLAVLAAETMRELEDTPAETEDEDKSILVTTLLEALETVLDVLNEKVRKDIIITLVPAYESLLALMLGLHKPTTRIHAEFFDSACTLLYTLLAYLEDVALNFPALWTISQRLITLYQGDCDAFTEDAVRPLSELVKAGGVRMAGAPGPAGVDWVVALHSACVSAESAADEEADRALMLQLPVALFHYARGAVDRGLGPFLELYVPAMVSARTTKLKSALAGFFGAALAYNPALVVQHLGPGNGALPNAEGIPIPATSLGLPGALLAFGNCMSHVNRSMHAKFAVLGLSALLKCAPLNSMPPALRSSAPMLLSLLAEALNCYDDALTAETAARAEAEEGEGEEEEDDESVEATPASSSAAAALLAGAPSGEGEDVLDQADVEYYTSLAARRAARAEAAATPEAAAGAGAEEEDDEDDGTEMSDDWSLADQSPPEGTPLSHVSHVLFAAEAMAFLAAQPDSQPLQAGVNGAVGATLARLMAESAAQRGRGVVRGDLGPAPPEAVTGAMVSALRTMGG